MENVVDNIKVCVRVRPLNEREKLEDSELCVGFDQCGDNKLELLSKPDPKTYAYDWVGGLNTQQEEIFINIGQPMVTKCLEGTFFDYFCKQRPILPFLPVLMNFCYSKSFVT